jgi:hypothetical protein
MRHRVWLLLLPVWLCACTSGDRTRAAKPLAPLLPLQIDDSEGFADLDVPAQLVSADARAVVVRARASSQERSVDVEVRFLDLSAGSGGSPFGQGRVEIRPIGEGGDALVAALAAAWKLPPTTRRMKEVVSAPVAVLGGGNAPTEPIKTKLFLQDGEAEVFLNWNPSRKTLEIHEKDQDYRVGVVAALSR